MRLWLDDERRAPEEWIAVTSAEDAIRLLNTGLVEEVSLDHDLGQSRNGYEVASYIEEAAHFNRIPKLRWNVHSMNPVGRKRMTKCLERADLFWEEHEPDLRDKETFNRCAKSVFESCPKYADL